MQDSKEEGGIGKAVKCIIEEYNELCYGGAALNFDDAMLVCCCAQELKVIWAAPAHCTHTKRLIDILPRDPPLFIAPFNQRLAVVTAVQAIPPSRMRHL